MSGETEQNVSAWTIDSLRYHLEQIATDLDKRYQQRFEAQEKAVESAFAAQDELLHLLTKMLDERYDTQTKAVDAAFVAQKTAMETAFTAADRAVQAALESAEKAVGKAEAASEKRFEAVNEFRGQLDDQARRLMPRAEYDAAHIALIDKVDTGVARNAERIADVELRLNGVVSQKAGGKEQLTAIYALAGFVVTLLVIGGFLAAAGVFTK